jgi:hypothetical protein
VIYLLSRLWSDLVPRESQENSFDRRAREGTLKTETIVEVGMDDERRVFVRPAVGDFEQVYRAAMEVYWDRSTSRLSHPRPPKDWTPAQWFQQIVAAVADEYGVHLKLTNGTIWVGVPPEVRAEIEADPQSRAY